MYNCGRVEMEILYIEALISTQTPKKNRKDTLYICTPTNETT